MKGDLCCCIVRALAAQFLSRLSSGTCGKELFQEALLEPFSMATH
jgi:hypothetical protein